MSKKIEVFVVDSNVPVPPARGSTNVPFGSLEVGDSVRFNLKDRPTVQSYASQIKARTGKAFTIRKIDDDHCRIWRTK